MAADCTLRYLLPAMAALTVVLSSCSGKSPAAPEDDRFLVGPEGGIHAGYVPPTGRDVDFEVRNPTARPVSIVKVRKSCGCTVVSVPEVVAPHQSVRGIIHIAGDQLPAIRNVTIHLETSDPMKSLTIPVKFGTGMVPCIQPPHATFRDIGEEMTAATNLWVEAQKGDRFAIESTEFEVEIQRGERHALTETPTIVAIREDGLCCLPLLLRLKGDAVSRGSGSITYTCAHEVRAVRVPYSIVQEECIAISPASVEMYFGRGQQQSLERVFVATAPFQFAPEVVESPDFCNARFEKISERSWKLIAAVNPNDLPDGIAGFEIRVASSAAGKDKIYRDRCLINVVDKRSREGADDR